MLKDDPKLACCIRRYVGALDFIRGGASRYCLWLKDIEPRVYLDNREIRRRLDNVRYFREDSTSKPTRDMSTRPEQFFFVSQPTTEYLFIPSTTSDHRQYIPMGFLPPEVIASNTSTVLPSATLYHFGVFTSSVHMACVRIVAGYHGTSLRYSVSVVYNTFPWAAVDAKQRSRIARTAKRILEVRKRYPNRSLASLYDEQSMPKDLRAAHAANDRAVLDAYGFSTNLSEAEIVARLMEMYRQLTQ